MRSLEVFWRFLLLGCVSFGGPAAHIGYFQRTFVESLRWLNQEQYSRLVALSQFLPGPGSSQVGFSIGLQRAGLLGGLAAFIGFTLPSFFLMLLLATGSSENDINALFTQAVSGLKLLAVVVVADAIITMFKSFCQHWLSIAIALLTAAILCFYINLSTQLSLLVLAGITGIIHFRFKVSQGNPKPASPNPISPSASSHTHGINYVALAAFFVLFVGLTIVANETFELKLFKDFYHAGSLVFGGGHVVLPLLQHITGDSLSNDQFLTGYATAQAVPGPMFTLATYLGAELSSSTISPLSGALLATAAIFLPGFLLILAFGKSWEQLLANPIVAGASWGINAAVVGLLIATFYNPVLTNAVHGWQSLTLCIIGLMALRYFKCSILILVLSFISIGFFI